MTMSQCHPLGRTDGFYPTLLQILCALGQTACLKLVVYTMDNSSGGVLEDIIKI